MSHKKAIVTFTFPHEPNPGNSLHMQAIMESFFKAKGVTNYESIVALDTEKEELIIKRK